MSQCTPDSLVAEFLQYVAERTSRVEMKRLRIETLVGFLSNERIRKCKLHAKVLFMRDRGFSPDEIETAVERMGNERDYLSVLENKFEDEEDEKEASEVVRGEVAKVRNQPEADGSKRMVGDTVWRLGRRVYAYKGNHAYYLVPLVTIDETRREDILGVTHQLESGEYGAVQFFPAGFKGVVPDEFAIYEAVQPGATIICEVAGGDHEHFKEAVVLGKSAKLTDDDYTVDLEWVHSSELTRGVDWHSIRLLLHPKTILLELQRMEEYRRKNLGTTDRVRSSTLFPFWTIAQESTLPEKHCMTGYLRNFLHYPSLDLGEPMRNMRTAAEFLSHFGESRGNDGVKYFPLAPSGPSGVGFEFNLSGMEHHSQSQLYYLRNPIVEVAQQCVAKDSMFIDPDFPPSLQSLYGGAASKHLHDEQGAMTGNIVGETEMQLGWRRLSECMYRPRINVVGSRPLELQPGYFTPPWMTNVIHSLCETAEFEDIISPEQDGWVYGAYVVRLFIDGRWAFVLVDDFVPCDTYTGNPLCLLSGSPNEIYCCLLEKAIAKLEGSYSALKYCRNAFSVASLWEDYTSNMSECFDHDLIPSKDAVNENMQAAVTRERKYCKIHARCRGEEEKDEEFGFDRGAYWLVDSVSQYVAPTRRQAQYFYHVVRPPNVGAPLSGIEGLRERFFQQMPAEAVDSFPEVKESAVSYWMASADYFRIFDRTVMLWFFNNVQKMSFEGTFAGRNDICSKVQNIPRWLGNPQIQLSIMQPTQLLIECKLLDRRILHDRIRGRTLQAHLLAGKLSEHPMTDEDPINVVGSTPSVDIVDDDEGVARPAAMLRLSLPSGNYVLIPNVGTPSDEHYILKVFSMSAFTLKLLN